MSHTDTVLSPITHGPASFVRAISKDTLIELYADESGIDIRYLLNQVDEIRIYQCNQTGYRFFYPYNIAGDSKFYEQLELIPWYYADWKWDYDVANPFIQPNTKVLDIGCGEGKFLAYLEKEKQCICAGLELNEKAKQIANEHDLAVFNEFIQDHAVANEKKYDTVTFFQVLEHISEIDSFMQAAIKVVKPGGQIIVAVPNNEPFYLTYDKDHFLNLPPHHMGWWNEQSLSALAGIYNLEKVSIVKQPLEHYSGYAKGFLKNKLGLPNGLVKLLSPIFKVIFYLNRKHINGASIMAVYRKPN